MAVNGVALASVAAGSLFVYSGIKGFSVTHSLQNVIKGQSANKQQVANPVTTPEGQANPFNPGTTTSSIASAALKYKGQGYVWGGNASKPGDWDCSSFVSYVLGHDLGMPLPGGKWGDSGFPPNSHGPPTVAYLAWSGAQTVGHTASVSQAGDLCVWQTHMGIAIGNGQMISARDPAEGVGIDNIAGDVPGELLFVRRIVIGNPHG